MCIMPGRVESFAGGTVIVAPDAGRFESYSVPAI